MTTSGVVEVLVHLERFRNIDLYYQGLYYLKLTCSLAGTPLQPVALEHSLTQLPVLHPHKLLPAKIIEADNAVASRTFFLRYTEETVDLNEVGVFRAEAVLRPGYVDQALLVQADLYFTDLGGTITLSKVYDVIDQDLQFKLVHSNKFRVVHPMLGTNQYVPVVFDDLYSCVFHSTFHCMLVDYKFLHNKVPVETAADLASVVFPGAPDLLEEAVIDKAYHSFVMLLTLTYNKLRRLILRVYRAADVRNRRELVPPSIKLPLTVDILTKMHHSTDSALTKAPLTTCIKTRDKLQITQLILDELQAVALRLNELKSLLCRVTKEHSHELVKIMEFNYTEAMKLRLEENFLTETHYQSTSWAMSPSQSSSHHHIAKNKRNSKLFKFVEPLEVEDLNILPATELNTIIHEELYRPVAVPRTEWSPDKFSSRCLPEARQHVHLFVLVHGLMGSSFDLKYIKDTILLHLPQSIILSSKANEQMTEDSIELAGQRLAVEVESWIEGSIHNEWLSKLTFIGHSMGGLIIRAALPLLAKYKSKMNLLMTMSTPHLGCKNGKSKLIEAGLWLITRFKRALSLKQLAMNDTSDPRQGTLFRLSTTQGMEWFKLVVLTSSTQDHYVPYESARIQAHSGIQLEMAQNIMGRLANSQVARISVNFSHSSSTFGSLIGRKAHIHVLDNKSLLTMLIYHYGEFFM